MAARDAGQTTALTSSQRGNQHKPTPPDEELESFTRFYYSLRGETDDSVCHKLQDHFDTRRYGLSVKSLRRLKSRLGILGTRQQAHTFDSIVEQIKEIKTIHPSAGALNIQDQLRINYGIKAPVPLITRVLKTLEPEAVKLRAGRGLVRRFFYCAGVNALWVMDQHDKWIRFGLYLHNCLDPYTGWNNWLTVWWSNRNPRLVSYYYLQAVRSLGAVPLITQSDGGSENFGVANMHSVIRQTMDPTLAGSLQHRFKKHKFNIKSEANWSVFRRDFSPGYERLFQLGVDEGWYDPQNSYQRLLFQWLVIPWLQTQLDQWIYKRNHVPPRANKKKFAPHGPPVLIRQRPQDYKSVDFKLDTPVSLLDTVQKTYAPPDHPVFQLSPPWFHYRAQCVYDLLERPEVTFKTLWDIYMEMWPLLLEIQHEIDVQEGLRSERASNCTRDVGQEESELLSSKWIGREDLLQSGAFKEVTQTRGHGLVSGTTDEDALGTRRSRKIIFAKGDEYVDYVSDLGSDLGSSDAE